jgi:hypothetical protein
MADPIISEKYTASIFSPEYGGSMFLRNIGVYLQVHMASQPRIPTSTTNTMCCSNNAHRLKSFMSVKAQFPDKCKGEEGLVLASPLTRPLPSSFLWHVKDESVLSKHGVATMFNMKTTEVTTATQDTMKRMRLQLIAFWMYYDLRITRVQ